MNFLIIPGISPRLARFCVVGASGVIINMGVLIFLTEALHWPYVISSLFAIETSILTNFALNNAWTWSDRKSSPLVHRLIKYHFVAGLTALAANWCLLIVLTRYVGWDYRVSNLIGIVAGVALNFFLNHIWTFGVDVPDSESASMDAASPVAASSESSHSQTDQTFAAGNDFKPRLERNRLFWLVIAAVVAITGAKLYFAAHAELLPEEAYYWTYFQHPAWGYFDHPPMVAWVVGAGTTLLGNTELGVRLGTILLSLGSSLWVFLLARLWFGQKSACWAVLLFNLLPISLGVGLLAFPDGPLIFFWLLTLYAVSKAIGADAVTLTGESHTASGTGATSFWLLAGLAFGAALLSKYTAVLLGGSLGLFLLTSPAHRHWLRRPQPWLAGIVAALVFMPVVIWNSQNDWASFLFQSKRTAGDGANIVKTVTDFWLFQLLILGPLFVVFALAIWRGLKRGWLQREDRWNFAVSFSLPLFLVFVFASFKTEVHINWTAPCFLSLLPAAAAILQEGFENPIRVRALRWQRFGAAAVAFAVFAGAVAFGVVFWGVPRFMISSRFGGWRQLSTEVAQEEAKVASASGQKPFVIGADKYGVSAELGFYGRDPQNQINDLALGRHGLGFHYWTDLRSFEGRPAVTIATRVHAFTLTQLSNRFEHVEAPRQVIVPTLGDRTRTVWLVPCYGYSATPKKSSSGRRTAPGAQPALPTKPETIFSNRWTHSKY